MTQYQEGISPGGERAIDRMIGQSEGAKNRQSAAGIASARNRTQLAMGEQRGEQFREYQQHQQIMQDKQMQAQERQAQRIMQMQERERNAALEFARRKAIRTKGLYDKYIQSKDQAEAETLKLLKAQTLAQKGVRESKHALKQFQEWRASDATQQDQIRDAALRAVEETFNRIAISGTPEKMAELVPGGSALLRNWGEMKTGGAVTPEEAAEIQKKGMWKVNAGESDWPWPFGKKTKSTGVRQLTSMEISDSLSHNMAKEIAKAIPQLAGKEGELRDTIRNLYFALMEGAGDDMSQDNFGRALAGEIASAVGGKTAREVLDNASRKLQDEFPEIGMGGLELIINSPKMALDNLFGAGTFTDEAYEFYGGSEQARSDMYKRLAAKMAAQGGALDAGTLERFDLIRTFGDLYGLEATYIGAGGQLVPRKQMMEMEKFLQEIIERKPMKGVKPGSQWGAMGEQYQQSILDKITEDMPYTGDLDTEELMKTHRLRQSGRDAELAAQMGMIDTMTAGELGGYVP